MHLGAVERTVGQRFSPCQCHVNMGARLTKGHGAVFATTLGPPHVTLQQHSTTPHTSLSPATQRGDGGHIPGTRDACGTQGGRRRSKRHATLPPALPAAPQPRRNKPPTTQAAARAASHRGQNPEGPSRTWLSAASATRGRRGSWPTRHAPCGGSTPATAGSESELGGGNAHAPCPPHPGYQSPTLGTSLY